MIIGPLTSGLAVGSNGVATAHLPTTLVVRGVIYQVQFKYSVAAASCTATLSTKGTNPPSITLLSIAGAKADGLWQPRVDPVLYNGVATNTQLGMYTVEDYLDLLINLANAGDYVQAWVYLFRD